MTGFNVMPPQIDAAANKMLNSALLALISRVGVPVLLGGGFWMAGEMVQLRRDIDMVQSTLKAAAEMALERRSEDRNRQGEHGTRLGEVEKRLGDLDRRMVQMEARQGATR